MEWLWGHGRGEGINRTDRLGPPVHWACLRGFDVADWLHAHSARHRTIPPQHIRFMPPESIHWYERRYGGDLSRDELTAMLQRAVDHHRTPPRELLPALLRLGGPAIVTQHLPTDKPHTVTAAVVETAVRVGVGLQHLERLPNLRPVLRRVEAQRGGLAEFLFG